MSLRNAQNYASRVTQDARHRSRYSDLAGRNSPLSSWSSRDQHSARTSRDFFYHRRHRSHVPRASPPRERPLSPVTRSMFEHNYPRLRNLPAPARRRAEPLSVDTSQPMVETNNDSDDTSTPDGGSGGQSQQIEIGRVEGPSAPDVSSLRVPLANKGR